MARLEVLEKVAEAARELLKTEIKCQCSPEEVLSGHGYGCHKTNLENALEELDRVVEEKEEVLK